MPTRIVQITDCHLLADPDEPFKDIYPHRHLRAVLRLARKRVPHCRRVVLTGDLAHDEQLETYRALHEQLGDWAGRCRVIPGNHDDRAALRSVFVEGAADAEGPVDFAESVDGWRLLGLDTQSPADVHGCLGVDQLAWLAEQLRTHPLAPTLLFLHHPPVSVGSDWLDAIGLEEPAEFAELVSGSPQIRGIFAGHVHQEFAGRLAETPVFCTPATSTQFRPGTTGPEFDSLPPGFRVLELGPTDLRTHVVRVEV